LSWQTSGPTAHVEARQREDSDGALVAAARAGDRQAFDTLYRRHYARVRGFAGHMAGEGDVAEEVTQAAFVRAYLSLHRMRDGQAFLRWVYRIVLNILRDRARSPLHQRVVGLLDLWRKRSESADTPEPEAFADSGQDPARQVERQALDARLSEAIAALPLPFREVVVLHHLQEMDIETIAETLQVPTGTVKSRLGRARARLREALSDWFAEERDDAVQTSS